MLDNSLSPREVTGAILKLEANHYPDDIQFDFKYNDLSTGKTVECFFQNRVLSANSISIKLIFPLDEWVHEVSISDFILKYPKCMLEKGGKVTKNLTDNAIHFCVSKEISNGSIIDSLEALLVESNEVLSKLNSEMETSHYEDVFVRLFDFPSEYQNIYAQYLMWFGEFLKNLGLDADAHTEPKSGKTALIVSPKNNQKLLVEIEKLFYQYIQLPYVEILPPQREMSIQEQHSFMAIRQQVQLLEMQIQAKDSLLLNDNATISSLNATVATQANLIQTQADKLTLVNGLLDKDKWANVPFTEGIFKCKNFGKKTMSIKFEPLALYNKLDSNSEESDSE